MIQMMPNTHIKLDSCQICNQILKNIAVKGDLCEAVFHKRCANVTKQQLRLIHCKNISYLCISCYEVFPFQEISDDAFVYENYSVEDTYDYLISDFNIKKDDAFHITRGTRRGGGVALYTNKTLPGTLRESK